MKEIIIWPVYLDVGKSRKEGRKVSKELGIKTPKLKNIYNILIKMGYTAELIKNKSYPKEPWETVGYIKVKVNDDVSKTELIKKICKKVNKKNI
ncbi:signal recognition particle subunit SRP19/SEC65 family protein [Methanothermococcus sp.]|uniref:signal recognition particle subunit SRP19/SEC65 family protein n=1 Tax=Methanothermococcus sp. TaxID=2614238 RepID=UPI0025D7E7ED|nr:signal recognition particle subunit SRP19/SEC65 family protein [Methanothermococcus sp.]